MFGDTQFSKLREKYESELAGLLKGVPADWHLARFIVERPDDGRRVVWLMVALDLDVTDRVMKHFEMDRNQVYAEAFRPILDRRRKKGQYVPERLSRWL